MGKIILYTGGARSGKSRNAQLAAEQYGDVGYVATAVRTDGEMEERIRRHVANRPQNWVTYECPRDIAGILDVTAHSAYLIDCITVFIGNHIFEARSDWDDEETLPYQEMTRIEEHVYAKIDELISFMRRRGEVFIVVTNEVGLGVVPPSPMGRIFRDIVGMCNQKLAAEADEVYFTVSGIPMKIK